VVVKEEVGRLEASEGLVRDFRTIQRHGEVDLLEVGRCAVERSDEAENEIALVCKVERRARAIGVRNGSVARQICAEDGGSKYDVTRAGQSARDIARAADERGRVGFVRQGGCEGVSRLTGLGSIWPPALAWTIALVVAVLSVVEDATVLASETKPRLVVDVDCAIAAEPVAFASDCASAPPPVVEPPTAFDSVTEGPAPPPNCVSEFPPVADPWTTTGPPEDWPKTAGPAPPFDS
jgi:hypothetical protein